MSNIILPDGWFSKLTDEGHTYYYDIHGQVSWLPPPPRPKAPVKIRTFLEESSPMEDVESDDEEEVLDKWVEDVDDVGAPIELPLSAEGRALRIAQEASAMLSANKKISGRFELNANTWGGEPHPRLGCGERMRLGYRPPPPWQASDTVASTTKSVSTSKNREWMVDGTKTLTETPNEIFTARPPIGGFHGTVVQVVASDEHSYLRTSEGFIYSWGRNVFGQLGLGDVETRAVPCLIPSLATDWFVTHISCNGSHALVIAKSRKPSSPKTKSPVEGGTLLSWGKGRDGALGLGLLEDSHVPEVVPSLAKVSIACCSAGATTSLAATTTGALYCWGNNTRGLCGLGDAPRTQSALRAAARQSRLFGGSSINSGSMSTRPSTGVGGGSRPGTSSFHDNNGSFSLSTRQSSTSPERPETNEEENDLISINSDISGSPIRSDLLGDNHREESQGGRDSDHSMLLLKKEVGLDPSRDGHLCVSTPTLCPTLTKGVKLVSCGKYHSIVLCDKVDAEECTLKASIARKARREAEKRARLKEERKKRRAERAAIAAANGGRSRWGKKKVIPEDSSDDDDDDDEEEDDEENEEENGDEDGENNKNKKNAHGDGIGEFSVSESFVESFMSNTIVEDYLDGFGPETRGSLEDVVDHLGSNIMRKRLSFKGQEVVLLCWGYGNRAGLGLGLENSHTDVDVPTILPVPILTEFDPWIRLKHHSNSLVTKISGSSSSSGSSGGGGNNHQNMEEVLSIATSCHSVLLTASGGGLETHVYTWGDADHGKCGIEPPKRNIRGAIKVETGPLDCVPVAVYVPTLVKDFEGKKIVSISAGGFATAACTDYGKVYACGYVGNKITMDKIAQQREVLDNPRPRELIELTQPNHIMNHVTTTTTTTSNSNQSQFHGVDVIEVSLGMRHAIALSSHKGCFHELIILNNIQYIVNHFNPYLNSLLILVDLNIEPIHSAKKMFDQIVPDSIKLLQPLLDEAYECGLNGNPIVKKGEDFESNFCDLKTNILKTEESLIRRYLCCCLSWKHKNVRKPLKLKRREKRIHNPNVLGPKTSENGRSKGDPNFFDGAVVKSHNPSTTS